MSQRVSKQTGLSLCPSFSLPCGGCGSFPPMTDSQPATPRSCFPLHSWLFVRWRILIDIIPVVIHVASMIYPRAQSPRQRREVLRSYSYITHASLPHFLHHSHNLINVRLAQIQAFHRLLTQTIHMFQHHLPGSRTPLIHKLGHYPSKPPTFPHKPPACVAHSETSVPRHPPRFAR